MTACDVKKYFNRQRLHLGWQCLKAKVSQPVPMGISISLWTGHLSLSSICAYPIGYGGFGVGGGGAEDSHGDMVTDFGAGGAASIGEPVHGGHPFWRVATRFAVTINRLDYRAIPIDGRGLVSSFITRWPLHPGTGLRNQSADGPMDHSLWLDCHLTAVLSLFARCP